MMSVKNIVIGLVFCMAGCSFIESRSLVRRSSQSVGDHIISFIIPCYNRGNTIRKAVESIYQQGLPQDAFEVICVDDASTDNTLRVLYRYAKKYQNFKVYRNEQNMGAGLTRNVAVSHSKGDLIFNLDSDNYLAPHSIKPLVKLIDQTGADGATFSAFNFFYIVGIVANKKVDILADKKFISLDDLLNSRSMLGSGGNYLYTRESFDRAGGYSDLSPMETWSLAFKQCLTGGKIAILPDSFYWHRVSPQGNWMTYATIASSRVMNFLTHYIDLFKPETQELIRDPRFKDKFFDKRGIYRLVDTSKQKELAAKYSNMPIGSPAT